MKLFATFVAAAMAQSDCPANSGWSYDSTAGTCDPVGVTVTCSATAMTVSFNSEHLYLALDTTHVDAATSAAYVGTCTSSVVQSTSGDYTLSFDLDDCGTDVTQSGGIITFSNTIYGSDDALRVASIITTSALSLDVSCTFADSLTVDIDDVSIEQDSFVMEEETDTGDFSSEFTLGSFVDSAFATAVDSSNMVTIGEPVYNKLEVSGSLPSNVDFFITECTAYVDNTYDASGTKYTIIDDGCMSNLVSASGTIGGDNTNAAEFQFNGFTFDSGDDQLYVRCAIDICAVNANGDVIDSTCGYSASSCGADTAATAISYA